MLKILFSIIIFVTFSFATSFETNSNEIINRELEKAIVTNDIDLLQKLHDLKVDFNNFSNKDKKPPIFLAMYDNKREKAAKFLLENGVDKDSVYRNEQILFNAVENHFSEDFIKYLISIGCDKNYFKESFTSSTGNNSYIYAKMYRNDFYSKELISLLKPDDYKNIKLAYLYLKNRLFEDLSDFIKNNDDITLFEKDDYVNFLSELTKRYYFYNLTTEQKNEAIEVMKLLIKKGADLNKTTKENQSSFENIVFGEHLPKEFIQFALTYDNPNKNYFIKVRNTNWTPLFGAISSKNIEAVDLLLEKDANINYMDESGLDAFYLAIYNGQIDIAKKLISVGFKPKFEPIGTRYPLSIAVLNNDIKMIEYLQSIGYDIHKELFGRKNLLEFTITNPA